MTLASLSDLRCRASRAMDCSERAVHLAYRFCASVEGVVFR